MLTLCLLFAPALHTRMKRGVFPNPLTAVSASVYLTPVTRPTHLGESAKKAKTFIGDEEEGLSITARDEKKKEKDSRSNTNLLFQLAPFFPSARTKKRKNYYLSLITSRWYDYPPSSPSVTPPTVNCNVNANYPRLDEPKNQKRRTPPLPQSPCFYLGVTNFSPRGCLPPCFINFN